MALFEVFLDAKYGFKAKESQEKKMKYINLSLLYSMSWGFGGSLSVESMEKLSDILRQSFGKLVKIGEAGDTFDYYLHLRKFD